MTIQELIVRMRQYVEGAKRTDKFSSSSECIFLEYFAEFLDDLDYITNDAQLENVHINSLLMTAFDHLLKEKESPWSSAKGENELAQEYSERLERHWGCPNFRRDGHCTDKIIAENVAESLAVITGKEAIERSIINYLFGSEWVVIRKRVRGFLRDVYANGLRELMDKWSQTKITLQFSKAEMTIDRGVGRLIPSEFENDPEFENPTTPFGAAIESALSSDSEPPAVSSGDRDKLRKITLRRDPKETPDGLGGDLYITVWDDDPCGYRSCSISHYSPTGVALSMCREVIMAWPEEKDAQEEFFQEVLVPA